MARPTELTPALQRKIVCMIRDGVTPEVAARAAGVAASTYYLWRQRGRDDESGPFSEFSEAIEKATAECEARAVHVVAKAFPTAWQSAMTLLERRFPDRWSRRDRLDVYHQVQREAERLAAELGIPVAQLLREAGVQFPVTPN